MTVEFTHSKPGTLINGKTVAKVKADTKAAKAEATTTPKRGRGSKSEPKSGGR